MSSPQKPNSLIGTNPVRGHPATRRLLHREVLRKGDLVAPLLIIPAHATESPAVLPTFAVSDLAKECSELEAAGVRGVKLFAASVNKDSQASEAAADDNLLIQAIREIKRVSPSLCIIADTCLCSFTSDGQCTLTREGRTDSQTTLHVLEKMASQQAAAGADFVAPSGMLDGAVQRIRHTLDQAGFASVGIFPHLILDSCLYGGYRSIMKAGGPGASISRSHQQLNAGDWRGVCRMAR